MGIVNFPSKDIFPTIPQTVQFTQANSTLGTYYTALTVTGRGTLSRILLNYYVSPNYIGSEYLYVRITIDSGTSVIINQIVTNGQNLRGIYLYSGSPSQMVFYASTTYFYKSCLVEVKQSHSSVTSDLNCIVDYSIV